MTDNNDVDLERQFALLEHRVHALEKLSHAPARDLPDVDDLDRTFAGIVARLAALEEPRPTSRAPPPPSPARIVLYRDMRGAIAPAIITRVYGDPPRVVGTAVDLFVFSSDDRFPQPRRRVECLVDGAGGVGWFWPPRV